MSKRNAGKPLLTSTPIPAKSQQQKGGIRNSCEKSNQHDESTELYSGNHSVHSAYDGKKEPPSNEKKKRGRPRKNKCENEGNEETKNEVDSSLILETSLQTELRTTEAITLSSIKSCSESNNNDLNSDAQKGGVSVSYDGENDKVKKKKGRSSESVTLNDLSETYGLVVEEKKSGNQNRENDEGRKKGGRSKKKVSSIGLLETLDDLPSSISQSKQIKESDSHDDRTIQGKNKNRQRKDVDCSNLSELSDDLSLVKAEESEKSEKPDKAIGKGRKKRGRPTKNISSDDILETSVHEISDKSVKKERKGKSDFLQDSIRNSISGNLSGIEDANKYRKITSDTETPDPNQRTRRERKPPKYFSDEIDISKKFSDKSADGDQSVPYESLLEVSLSETSITRKRGRPRKQKTPNDSMRENGGRTRETIDSSGYDKESDMVQISNTENDDKLVTEGETSKTKGNISQHVEDIFEDVPVKRRRGRPRKDETHPPDTMKKYQKRKFESVSPDTCLGEKDSVGKRRRISNNYIEADSEEEDDEEEEEWEEEKCSRTKNRMKGDSAKKGKRKSLENKEEMDGPQKMFECVHCQKQLVSKTGIKHHVAVEHQALWAPDCPEGKTDLTSLRQVIQIKKFLNCPRCGKRHNHHHYYKNHLEWCGREDETYICELCGSELIARWKKIHIDYCSKKKEEIELGIFQEKEKLVKEEEDGKDYSSGKKRKRKAAEKASAMLHDLSKGGDQEGNSDDDKDPDAKLEDEMSDEDDYDSDDIGDEHRINSVGCPGWRGFSRRRAHPDTAKFYVAIDKVLQYVEENYLRPVHPHLLPCVSDWILLSESEAKKYLPDHSKSAEFKFTGKMGNTTCLESFEGRVTSGQFSFYTGSSVWRVAWCPVPCDSTVDQYLAVTGSLDHDKLHPISEMASGPGLIQIWRVPISSNKKAKGSDVPQMELGIAHDYGFVTDMKWCPSGCWQSTKDPSQTQEQSVILRLGLLAISCSDSTIRIYSVPQPSSLSQLKTEGGPPVVYHAQPVLTLKPSQNASSHPITCSSLAWQSANNHQYMLGGFSDGTVRTWDLCTSSLMLQVNQELFPFHTFHAHSRVVRGCDWSKMAENYFVTASDDKFLKFWSLEETEYPIFQDRYSAFNEVQWPLLYPGALSASDDAMVMVSNRARYVEAGHVKCNLREEQMRNSIYFLTVHNAAIWSLGWSNWLNMAFFADNRGHIYAFPCPHFSVQYPDTKAYRYRLSVLKTTLKFKDEESKVNEENANERQIEQVNQPDNLKKNDPKLDEFKKNETGIDNLKNSEPVMDKSMENMPDLDDCKKNETGIDNLKNSEPVMDKSMENMPDLDDCKKNETGIDNLKNSEPVMDKSMENMPDLDDCKKNEALEDSSEKDLQEKSKNSKKKEEKGKKLKGKISGYEEIKKDNEVKPARVWPSSYKEAVEKTYLEYIESVETKSPGPKTLDEIETNIDCFPLGSLYSIAVNPNYHTCCWLASGGEAGIVRVQNIKPLIMNTMLESHLPDT